FNELTPHPHWEQRVPQNRQEHQELLSALSCPVSFDLCKAVARTEHVVGELSKLSESNDSEALSNGVSLFYEVLKFITSETKQYPPTCQFLSSCIQILGQEFIHRDPSQTATILQLLLAQRSLGDILAPLFDPNLCPPDFISMYVSVREVAIKEGPTIAFSTLTK
ncbi:PREDICTED: ectopic P granules protein 5 homolog, partial [Amphimedon queenslandica]|uniref:Epg5-like central TPR repeats domain-containing protein n=1 Tax=Amphimedon queenslandica TaxID=400682 RepID=A0AAN0K263_AMPQE